MAQFQQTRQNKTVYGYCHRLKPQIRIPSDIIKLCFAFYALILSDEWDTNKKSRKINIYQNIWARYPKQQKIYRQHLGTTFGVKVCTNGVHKWILRIVESNNINSNYSIVVGVVKNKFIDECLNNSKTFKHPGGTNAGSKMPVAFMRFNSIDIGYGFVANRACKMMKFNVNDHELWKYGERFRYLTHMMHVILDMDKHTLSFIINGTDYGKAFDVDKNSGYRLAVCMLPGITIELCDVEASRIPCDQILDEIFWTDMMQSIYGMFSWDWYVENFTRDWLIVITLVVVVVSVCWFHPPMVAMVGYMITELLANL
eukprot:70863_1